MVTSHLLVPRQCGELDEPGRFLRTLDEAPVVDQVAADRVVDAVIDFLGTEDRIQLPSGVSTDLGLPIRPAAGHRAISFLTRHQARVLRSRLCMCRGCADGHAASVCESFSLKGAVTPNAVQGFLLLLERQHEHFPSDDERVLIVSG